MPRPPSIVRFERLYLASFGLGLVGWAVSWNALSRQLAANPATARAAWVLPASLLLSAIVTLSLWYFVTRRASAMGKWIVVVLTALGALRFLAQLPAAFRGAMTTEQTLLGVVTVVLTVAAALQLFNADARGWFGEGMPEEIA